MTKYEIRFKEFVQSREAFVLNIMNVPVSQIYQDNYEPQSITVTIDPDWTETNFDTIIDSEDSIWLYPLSLKDTVIKRLEDLGRL